MGNLPKAERVFKYTLLGCIANAALYPSRRDWKLASPDVYAVAAQNGWLDMCRGYQGVARKSWTKEDCIKEAAKFTSIAAWRRGSQPSYRKAYQHGWLEECCTHFIKPDTFELTREHCFEVAKKYKTLSQWFEESPYTFIHAWKHGFFMRAARHMGIAPLNNTTAAVINLLGGNI